MNIRAPHPAESARITQLMRDSYEPRMQPYLVVTQSGATEFIRAHLQQSASTPERVPYVWAAVDGLLAFADFRTHPDGSDFLSYVCVDEHARGRGIATALVNQFIDSYSPRSLQLDVFRDNTTALAFYRKLGFEITGRSRWLVRAIAQRTSTGPLPLRNLHVGHACFAQYGFCELETVRAGQPIQVGRIGAGKLRVPTLEAFRDDAFLASARASFPSLDEALLIDSSSESTVDHGTQILAESVRLTLRLSPYPEGDAVWTL